MKRCMFLLAALSLFAAGCGKEETETAVTPQQADFTGTVTVTYQEKDYDNPGIRVDFTPSEDGKTATLTMYKIKFVPQMPVTIDVTIPDVALSVSGNTVTLSCDGVDPLAMGGPVSRYHVKNLTGTLTGETLQFSLLFGDYPTRFSGTKAAQ